MEDAAAAGGGGGPRGPQQEKNGAFGRGGKEEEGAAAGPATEAGAGGRSGGPRGSRRLQLACLAVLLLLFSLGLAGAVVLWGTSLWDRYIDQQLIIRSSGPSYDTFVNSPVTSTIKFWVFNYTNVADFRAGRAKKLRVADAGPYAFRERVKRLDVQFHDNGTVSYREERHYEFVPEASGGTMDDNITGVHVVLLGINYATRKMNFLQRGALWPVLRAMDPQPLVTRPARDWFWGYHDAYTGMAELADDSITPGIVQSANGTDPHLLTVHTGERDMRLLGQLSRFDGLERVDFYSGAQCNRLDGSAGQRYPPPEVRPGATLWVYHREACRRVPLLYDRPVTVWDGLPALRFRPPDDVFDNGDAVPGNQCYCTESLYDSCLPAGVVNTQHCRNGAPLVVSFPHFLHGDPALLEAVDGLRPDPERHSTHLDIHERVGAPVAVATRFQMNVLVRSMAGSDLEKRLDGKLLPFVWTERTMDEYPQQLRSKFLMLSFTAPTAHAVLRWLCPLLAATSALALALLGLRLAGAARGADAGADAGAAKEALALGPRKDRPGPAPLRQTRL